MIFQYTLEQVLDGSKTRTSRRNYGEELDNGTVYSISERYHVWPETGERELLDRTRRRLYYPGQILSVQPGRGQKGLARIKLLDITAVDVRHYGDAEVRHEGFATRGTFLSLWCTMHFPSLKYNSGELSPEQIDSLLSAKREPFLAWALDFELHEL